MLPLAAAVFTIVAVVNASTQPAVALIWLLVANGLLWLDKGLRG